MGGLRDQVAYSEGGSQKGRPLDGAKKYAEYVLDRIDQAERTWRSVAPDVVDAAEA